MMDWNGNMSSGGWILSVVMMIIVIGLVVLAITWIGREFAGRNGIRSGRVPSAAEVLDLRLARGEIKTEQYEALRRTLRGNPDTAAKPPTSA